MPAFWLMHTWFLCPWYVYTCVSICLCVHTWFLCPWHVYTWVSTYLSVCPPFKEFTYVNKGFTDNIDAIQTTEINLIVQFQLANITPYILSNFDFIMMDVALVQSASVKPI